MKNRLDGKRIKKSLALRTARVVDSLKDILKRWFEFYNGYDPLFTWWVEKPYRELTTSLENYSVFLRDKIAGVKKGEISRDPIGREALLQELSFEIINYTPEELIEIAKKRWSGAKG